MISPAKNISVIIPTYNGENRISKVLGLFGRQEYSLDRFEVIVVDDGSTDATKTVLENYHPDFDFKYIVHQQNKGRACACNSGIRIAQGHLIVLVDDDMSFEQDFLLAHACYHLRDDRVAVVGMVKLSDVIASSSFGRNLILRQEEGIEKNLRNRQSLPFSSSATGNFSARKEVLLEAGLFDEDFHVYGFEDWELGLRLSNAGVRLVYAPEPLARHDLSVDNFEKFCRRKALVGYSAATFFRKHPSMREILEIDSVFLNKGSVSNKAKMIFKMIVFNKATLPLFGILIFGAGIIKARGYGFLCDQVGAYYYRKGLKMGLSGNKGDKL